MTRNNRLDLPLKKGLNLLKVSGDHDCQGVIEKHYLIGEAFQVVSFAEENCSRLYFETPTRDAQIRVYNFEGQQVYRTTINPREVSQLDLPSDQWPSGVYIIQIQTATQFQSIKFLNP